MRCHRAAFVSQRNNISGHVCICVRVRASPMFHACIIYIYIIYTPTEVRVFPPVYPARKLLDDWPARENNRLSCTIPEILLERVSNRGWGREKRNRWDRCFSMIKREAKRKGKWGRNCVIALRWLKVGWR